MAGLFPGRRGCFQGGRSLGYREVTAGEGCPFRKRGRGTGHEFHYSEMTPSPGTARAYMIKGGDGSKEPEGYVYRNTLVSYVHLHFASNPEFTAVS